MSGLFTAVAGLLLYCFYLATQSYDFETLGWVVCAVLLVLNCAAGFVLYKRSKDYDN